MRLWRFSDPVDDAYARASRRGTWEGSTRVRPLVIEWEPGSDVVGDFVWPGFDDDIASARSAAGALSERFDGFELGPIEMVQTAKPPKRGGKPRVWLPYRGPELVDLWVTAWSHVDLDRSSVRQSTREGKPVYSVEGVEVREVGWDQERREAKRVHIPRKVGQGLYVERAQLDGEIFRVHEFPAWVLCTDEVKAFIEQQRFTNAGFLEMGEVF